LGKGIVIVIVSIVLRLSWAVLVVAWAVLVLVVEEGVDTDTDTVPFSQPANRSVRIMQGNRGKKILNGYLKRGGIFLFSASLAIQRLA
jgi:hypothetical protein